MIEFLCGSDLWVNIIGGAIAAGIAAGLIALIVSLCNRRKHRIRKALIEIMGQAIEHRNIGEQRTFTNEKEWIEQAKVIEGKAVAKAKELSPDAGSLVEWLDRVEPWEVTSEVSKYVSILGGVIERIRGLMERNS